MAPMGHHGAREESSTLDCDQSIPELIPVHCCPEKGWSATSISKSEHGADFEVVLRSSRRSE